MYDTGSSSSQLPPLKLIGLRGAKEFQLEVASNTSLSLHVDYENSRQHLQYQMNST